MTDSAKGRLGIIAPLFQSAPRETCIRSRRLNRGFAQQPRAKYRTLRRREPYPHRGLIVETPRRRQRTRFAFDVPHILPERPWREDENKRMDRPVDEAQGFSPATRVRRLHFERRLQFSTEGQRKGVAQRHEGRLLLKRGSVQFERLGPRRLERRLRLEKRLRRRGVRFACAVAINVAAVNHSTMARNEQRHMRAPGAKRTLDALSPHWRMHRCANLAKEMGATGLRVESRRRLPVQPADVVLLRRKQQWLAERLIPGAQNLT